MTKFVVEFSPVRSNSGKKEPPGEHRKAAKSIYLFHPNLIRHNLNIAEQFYYTILVSLHLIPLIYHKSQV